MGFFDSLEKAIDKKSTEALEIMEYKKDYKKMNDYELEGEYKRLRHHISRTEDKYRFMALRLVLKERGLLEE